MDLLIHPTYFPNIAHFVGIVQADHVFFEMHDNFEKQTLRSRTYIYAANGKLLLNIPVSYTQKKRKLYKEVEIVNQQEFWQSNHWKSLESAYKTSPFFEFYEDDLRPLFIDEATNIMDFNLKCFRVVCDCLQLNPKISYTNAFDKNPIDMLDLRSLVEVKKSPQLTLEPYTQVFDDKHGFIDNLSILDLLFNEGPNALNYLESQSFDFY